MTIDQTNLFYDELRKTYVKPDSSWTDKAKIFRTILEQFFLSLTKDDDLQKTLFERINAYYDEHPEEELMRDKAHQVRIQTNRTVHNSMEFRKTYVKHTTITKEEVREIYENMVLIIYNATQIFPCDLTLELLGVNRTNYLNNLNEQQKDAVMSDKRIVFVNAGPGTGKTTLLVQRIVHAVSCGSPQNHIVALSFTNTAAKQLEDKFQKQAFHYLKNKEYELFNGTIHSYCLRNLRKYNQISGSSFNYLIIGDDEFLEMSHDIYPSVKNAYTLEQLNEILKGNRKIWPEDIKQAVDHLKKVNNFISLNDILILFYEKLKTDIEFSQWILQAVDMLIIDEAQDLSEWNFKIFDLMLALKPELSLFMVGDPRQNIFEFNGGSYKYLSEFLNIHSEETDIKSLSQSYRCPNIVLDYVNNFNFIDCENVALRSELNGSLEFKSCETSESESKSIAEIISEIGEFDTCAVISPNVKGLNGIAEQLNKRQIPFIVHGGNRRVKLHIRYINHLLKILLNNNIKSIRAIAKTLGLDLRTQPVGAPKNFSEKELFYRTAFGRKLYKISQECSRFEYDFTSLICVVKDNLLPSEWIGNELIRSDFEKVLRISRGYKTIKEYTDAFSLNKDRFLCFYEKDFIDCTSPLDGPCVTLSTIHSAKGLEWKHVFIVGMCDKNFPGIKKYDKQNPQKHEVYLNTKRKELFVALTRSSECLYISYPAIDAGQEQIPSMLLAGLEVKS